MTRIWICSFQTADKLVLLCLLWTPVFKFHVHAEHEIDLDRLQQLQISVVSGKQTDELFTDFKYIFGRNYTDETEEATRYKIFNNRIQAIREHNELYERGDKSYSLGVNKFSDMTHKEFNEMYTSQRWKRKVRPKSDAGNYTETKRTSKKRPVKFDLSMHKGSFEQDLPTAVNWVQEGYVTEIKDQSDCGSCWAFAVTGAVEAQLFKNTGRVVSLSAQQLVDCDDMNQGCYGGHLPIATRYISSAGGIMPESEYPYTGMEDTCKFDSSKVVPGTNVQDTYVIYDINDRKLQEAVANVGPIIGVMDIHPEDYMNYAKGVYYNKNCSNLYSETDHAVLIVGYGTDPEDHWLIKNSMGTSWGERGFLKIARNRGNSCGISHTRALYPILHNTACPSVRTEHVVVIIMLSFIMTL